MNEAVAQYLANPMFRAARYEELVLDDNPYRRPVRPDDIGLVNFSKPLSRSNFSQLSSLMAHRMLLNIYDTEKLLLPRTPTPEKWRDYQQFYAISNRFLGDLIRPYLEAHVFGFLPAADGSAPGGEGDLLERIRTITDERRDQAAELCEVLTKAPDRGPLVQMLAVQAVATSLNIGGLPTAALRDLAGSVALPGVGADRTSTDLLRRVADRSGIRYEPHSYYQYYLPSTLGLMNYLNSVARDPGRVFAFAGALVGQAVEAQAVQELLSTVLAEAAGEKEIVPAADGGHAAIVELVGQVGGEFGLREFGRGLGDYAVLLDVHHEDRMRQLRWINVMPEYVEKARRLQSAITDNNIEVQLDTFVESWEECSTTHVHDEDRLLVIESGEMEFWNCFGTRHKLRAGDMTFIPKHRLHGSVVLTGECVYHQPVITAELDRTYG